MIEIKVLFVFVHFPDGGQANDGAYSAETPKKHTVIWFEIISYSSIGDPIRPVEGSEKSFNISASVIDSRYRIAWVAFYNPEILPHA